MFVSFGSEEPSEKRLLLRGFVRLSASSRTVQGRYLHQVRILPIGHFLLLTSVNEHAMRFQELLWDFIGQGP